MKIIRLLLLTTFSLQLFVSCLSDNSEHIELPKSEDPVMFNPYDCTIESIDTRCLEVLENTEVKCKDLKDNDLNTLIDCEDPGCGAFEFCQEGQENTAILCQDGLDNDYDDKTDCLDESCQNFSFCEPDGEITSKQCSDSLDNDNDTFTDCDDEDCKKYIFCQPPNENTALQCKDGIDNDGNGDTLYLYYKEEQNAASGVDSVLYEVVNTTKDYDAKTAIDTVYTNIDCDDIKCSEFSWCQPQNEDTPAQCKDGLDNDGNGDTLYLYYKEEGNENSGIDSVLYLTVTTTTEYEDRTAIDIVYTNVDCEDEKCFEMPACQPLTEGSIDPSKECLDGLDNDGDGDKDCADTDCADYSFCLPEEENNALECQDGLDNDHDGDTTLVFGDIEIILDSLKNHPDLSRAGADREFVTLVDCADESCKTFAFCMENSDEYCTDGIDNDLDSGLVDENGDPVLNAEGLPVGGTDCDDPDCAIRPICGAGVTCIPAGYVPLETIDFDVTIYDKAVSGDFDLRGAKQTGGGGTSQAGGCQGSYEDIHHTYTDSLWSPYQVVTGMVKEDLSASGFPVLDNNICYNGSINNWWSGTAISKSLTFTHEGNNVYKFLTDPQGFFPLDDCVDGGALVDGFVVPGAACSKALASRNYGFAVHLHREFMFMEEGSDQQFFRFSGDDDVFVFINKKLVLDLGGVHHPLDGSFTLGEAVKGMNLTSGDTLDFDVFIAERQMDGSQTQMSVNIPCLTVGSGL